MAKVEVKKSRKPKEKLQNLSIARLLPNIATVIALCIGLSSIRFALLGRFDHAVIAIIVAAIFDAMDGRLARLLGASSDFGAELDSLSDFVSFGAAPAVVLYILSMNAWKGFGWGISLFFAVCMGLRLARFNTALRATEENQPPAWTKKYFMGVPAPAGAMIALFPLILFLATDWPLLISPIVCMIFLVVAGGLLISRLPTYSLKGFQIPRGWALPALLVVGIFVAALLSEPWMTLSALVIFYLFSIPLSYLSCKRMGSGR